MSSSQSASRSDLIADLEARVPWCPHCEHERPKFDEQGHCSACHRNGDVSTVEYYLPAPVMRQVREALEEGVRLREALAGSGDVMARALHTALWERDEARAKVARGY